jgi:hypothetical protein
MRSVHWMAVDQSSKSARPRHGRSGHIHDTRGGAAWVNHGMCGQTVAAAHPPHHGRFIVGGGNGSGWHANVLAIGIPLLNSLDISGFGN